MVKRRIPTNPNDLRDQILQASSGIGGEPNWPPTAPTQAVMNTQALDLTNLIAAADSAKALLSNARTALRVERDAAVVNMKKIDEMTDALYGPDSTLKNNFGLPPKKIGGAMVPLDQVDIKRVEDGTSPASIYLDWDPEEGAAAYQVEWYLNPTMTGTALGNAAVSGSEMEINGLNAKQQYWIRVRAIRGEEFGQWSGPATRVASL